MTGENNLQINLNDQIVDTLTIYNLFTNQIALPVGSLLQHITFNSPTRFYGKISIYKEDVDEVEQTADIIFDPDTNKIYISQTFQTPSIIIDQATLTAPTDRLICNKPIQTSTLHVQTLQNINVDEDINVEPRMYFKKEIYPRKVILRDSLNYPSSFEYFNEGTKIVFEAFLETPRLILANNIFLRASNGNVNTTSTITAVDFQSTNILSIETDILALHAQVAGTTDSGLKTLINGVSSTVSGMSSDVTTLKNQMASTYVTQVSSGLQTQINTVYGNLIPSLKLFSGVNQSTLTYDGTKINSDKPISASNFSTTNQSDYNGVCRYLLYSSPYLYNSTGLSLSCVSTQDQLFLQNTTHNKIVRFRVLSGGQMQIDQNINMQKVLTFQNGASQTMGIQMDSTNAFLETFTATKLKTPDVQLTNHTSVNVALSTLNNQMSASTTSQLLTLINSLQTQINNIGQGVPVGTIICNVTNAASLTFGSKTFLRCDGQIFSQAGYPALYTALGNSTTVPNLNGRLLRYDTGAIRTNHGGNSVTLSTTNIPNHSHNIEYRTSTTKGGIWGGSGNNAGNYGWEGGIQGYAYTTGIQGYTAQTNVTIPTPLSYGVVYYIAAN